MSIPVDLEGVDPADAERVRVGVELLKGGASFESAFGATGGRDELLRQAWWEFFPAMSAHATAEAIATAWARYAETGWRHERLSEVCPAHRAGRIEGLFWRLMKAQDRTLSSRQIRRILAVGMANETDHD
jgi:hypothetical protein